MILEAMAAMAVIGAVIGPAMIEGGVLGTALKSLLGPGPRVVHLKLDDVQVEVDLSEFVDEEGNILIHYRIARGKEGEVVVLSKAEAEYIQFSNAIKSALDSGRPLSKPQLRKMLRQLVTSALEREVEIKKTTRRRGRKM